MPTNRILDDWGFPAKTCMKSDIGHKITYYTEPLQILLLTITKSKIINNANANGSSCAINSNQYELMLGRATINSLHTFE